MRKLALTVSILALGVSTFVACGGGDTTSGGGTGGKTTTTTAGGGGTGGSTTTTTGGGGTGGSTTTTTPPEGDIKYFACLNSDGVTGVASSDPNGFKRSMVVRIPGPRKVKEIQYQLGQGMFGDLECIPQNHKFTYVISSSPTAPENTNPPALPIPLENDWQTLANGGLNVHIVGVGTPPGQDDIPDGKFAYAGVQWEYDPAKPGSLCFQSCPWSGQVQEPIYMSYSWAKPFGWFQFKDDELLFTVLADYTGAKVIEPEGLFSHYKFPGT